ncbi:hypothetical protein [Latilactobacillus curvatus]|uniref:hypothetical protein n=1 Tax=Latilactobacillus curvatus TaxID=28038 RepID=UPI003EBCF896
MQKKLSKSAYGGVSGEKYVPYVNQGDKKVGNLAILIMGSILAIIFAASTAYSGMKAGLTVNRLFHRYGGQQCACLE